MDFTIVYCVTLTSYGKALYLHFYYLTIWTHCTCMYVYILSEIKKNYYDKVHLRSYNKYGLFIARESEIRNKNDHFS